MTLEARRCNDGGGTHRWVRRGDVARCAWCPAVKPVKPLPVKTRSAIPARSARRQSIAAERRHFVRASLAARRRCEFPPLADAWLRGAPLGQLGVDDACDVANALARCRTVTCDVHEIVSRARRGPIVPSQGLTPADVLCLCRACHDWITTHPRLAAIIGASKASWERPDHLNPKENH